MGIQSKMGGHNVSHRGQREQRIFICKSKQIVLSSKLLGIGHGNRGGMGMNIGDLVTWKIDFEETHYGVIIEAFYGSPKYGKHWWVKWINGHHAHKPKILCNQDHIKVVEDLNKKRT